MAIPLKERLARQASGAALLTFDPTGRDEAHYMQLPLSSIDPDPNQPRKNLGDLSDLALSIGTHGVFSPIIVEAQPDGRYRILAGERRFTASRSLGLPTIPCIIRSVEEQTRLELQLIENMHRKGLDPIEEARGMRRLMDEFNLSQRNLALRLGKSEATICQTLRILDLPPSTLEALQESPSMTKSVLLELAKESDPDKQQQLIQRSRESALTVREIRSAKKASPAQLPKPALVKIVLEGCTVTVRFEEGGPTQERVQHALKEALRRQSSTT